MEHTIPLAITDAMLTSNIVEVPPAAWNAGTTYAADAIVSIFSGPSATMATLYESLLPGNLNKAPATEPNWWRPAGVAYLPWSNGTNYALDAIVTEDHQLFQAMKAGSGHRPTTSGLEYWLPLGPTNRWAMFDRQIETRTTHPREIKFEIAMNGRFDTLGLFTVDAAAINVTVMKGAVEVFNKSYSMTSYQGIANYWDHFFNPHPRRRKLYLTGLPIFAGLRLIVTLTGKDVSVGHFAHGRKRRLGATLRGGQLGSVDYSEYKTDTFGRRSVMVREYKNQGRFDVVVKKPYVDTTRQAILDSRGTPAMICASDQYQSMIFFGLITSADVTVQYAQEAILRLQAEDF